MKHTNIFYGLRGTIIRSMTMISIVPLTITMIILFYFVNNYARHNTETTLRQSVNYAISTLNVMNNNDLAFSYLGSIRPAAGGLIFIINTDGQFLVHPARNGQTDRSFLEQIKDREFTEADINHDGSRYVLYRTAMPEKNIYVGAAILKADTMTLQKGFAFVLLLLVISTPFILLAIGIFIARSIRNPLKRIIDVASVVSTGDLTRFIMQTHYRKCTQINGCDKPDCPAHSTSNLACWGIKGTKCFDGMETMDVEEKIKKFCRNCRVYNHSIRGEFDELIEAINNMIVTTQNVVKSIKEVSSQVDAEADTLSKTIHRMETEMQNQAGAIEETTSSNEELAASVDSIATAARSQADRMANANRSMEDLSADSVQVNDKAANVSAKTRTAVENANATKSILDNTTSKINQISENSRKIVEIIQIINDISDQINLLSLNASIEAARAGEHGRGFAIVAEEISKLADATASSTKEIEKMIQQTRSDVSEGANLVNTTNRAIVQVIENINITSSLIDEITGSVSRQREAHETVLNDIENINQMSEMIAGTTAEQKVSSNEILKALSEVNASIQVMTRSTEDIGNSAEHLKRKSEELNSITNYFKVKR